MLSKSIHKQHVALIEDLQLHFKRSTEVHHEQVRFSVFTLAFNELSPPSQNYLILLC